MTKVFERTYSPGEHVLIDSKKKEYTQHTFLPKYFDDYIGQEEVKKKIEIYIESALKRNVVLDHILLFGPPGLGKTTLAEIIAKRMSKKIKITSGPVLQKTGDLLAILTNMKEGEIFFIDEIHRLPISVEESLYSAMEQYKIEIIIGSGSSAKTVSMNLPPFTLIGATTKLGLLSAPLRSRFGIVEKFEWYSASELSLIIKQTANFFNIIIDDISVEKIALVSRGTPRIAKKLMHKIRDYAIVKTNNKIDENNIESIFSFFHIFKNGLTPTDMQILTILEKKNYPIGLESISRLINEEVETIEEVYEPFLLQLGFIERTPRGRIINKEKKQEIKELIDMFSKLY
jgi:Holliday junction DNA helicase RuvB